MILDTFWPWMIRGTIIGGLYVVPVMQLLLTLSSQFRKFHLLPGPFPYIERWPVASDAAYALLFSLPLWLTAKGDIHDAAYFIALYIAHQLLWLKRRLAQRKT